jgi:hypothetical protein
MPSEDSLTGYIAEFAACTSFEAIPKEVMELGKKSILGILGPALTGSTSKRLPFYDVILRSQA